MRPSIRKSLLSCFYTLTSICFVFHKEIHVSSIHIFCANALVVASALGELLLINQSIHVSYPSFRASLLSVFILSFVSSSLSRSQELSDSGDITQTEGSSHPVSQIGSSSTFLTPQKFWFWSIPCFGGCLLVPFRWCQPLIELTGSASRRETQQLPRQKDPSIKTTELTLANLGCGVNR